MLSKQTENQHHFIMILSLTGQNLAQKSGSKFGMNIFNKENIGGLIKRKILDLNLCKFDYNLQLSKLYSQKL